MFKQIELRPEGRDALRYFWRGDRRDEHNNIAWNLWFLVRQATAINVKNIVAEKFRDQYLKAVEAIQKKHYVDGYLDCFKTEKKAINVATTVRDIYRHAHFELKKMGIELTQTS